MIVNKRVTKPGWVDPDDAPELTDEWFDTADFKIGDKVVRRGRPRGSNKEQISLRLDKEVIAKFKAGGPGWQSRMNDALKRAAGV